MGFRRALCLTGLVLLVGGLAAADTPDLNGTWRLDHAKGQTTLIISQSGNSADITVEGRNFLGFDQYNFVADGAARQAEFGTVTATWIDGGLTVTFEKDNGPDRLHGTRTITLTPQGAGALEVSVTGSAGRVHLKPQSHSFQLQ